MKKDIIKQLQQSIAELRREIEALKQGKNEEVFLDSYEMLRFLKCSPSKLYRLRRFGCIPCVLIGRRYLYPKHLFTEELLDTISKNEDPSKRFDDPV